MSPGRHRRFWGLARRGGRVVECTALEMRHTGNRIEGSNPSLSATDLSTAVHKRPLVSTFYS